MKKFIILLTIAFTLSSQAQETKTKVLKEFLSDIINFDGKVFNEAQPITSFKQLAQDNAAEIIKITHKNIKLALSEAKRFRHCLIIVENHTLIRIVDYEDCSPSNCWAACMPLSRAYIQKAGLLNEKNDYLNNVLGCPDTQKRMIYLFK